MEKLNTNFSITDSVLDNIQLVDTDKINSDIILAKLSQLGPLIEAQDVDGVQNLLEETYSIFTACKTIEAEGFKMNEIIPKIIFIAETIGEIPYIQSRCLLILSALFRRSPELLIEFAAGDFSSFLEKFLPIDMVTIVSPALDIISCLFMIDETREQAEEQGILAKLLDFVNSLLFDLSPKRQNYLINALSTLEHYVSCENEVEKLEAILPNLLEILNQCVGNNYAATLHTCYLIANKLAETFSDYILSETDFFQMNLNLLGVYSKGFPEKIVDISRCLIQFLVYSSSIEPHVFESVNVELYIKIFYEYREDSKVIDFFSTFVGDLLLKLPGIQADTFMDARLLAELDISYKKVNANAKQALINLYWLLAKRATIPQLEELVKSKSFKHMLDIFKYENDFLASVIDGTVLVLIDKIHSNLIHVFPMEHKIWHRIEKRAHTAEESENSNMSHASHLISHNINCYRRIDEEEDFCPS